MRYIKSFALSCAAMLMLLGGTSLTAHAQSKYRCLVQMKPYEGEKAYVVVSLVDAKGQYEQTLRVLGPDKRWYNSLVEWHRAQQKRPERLDAVTGASIAGGDRSVFVLTLDDSKLDKGYKIRFESSVEDQKYHVSDVEIPYTRQGLERRTDGKGYIKVVKLTPVK